MTISSETDRSGPYIGNGVTTVFNYGFRIINEAHLTVIKRNSNGVETTLTLDADYIVSDVGNPLGGQISITVAPATGTTITILRNVPFTQETDLENQGAYFAETIEAAFDLAVMRDQELNERLDRAVVIPPSADPSALGTLIADILRLSGSADNIDTVADNIGDVNIVATNIADMNIVADNIADVTNFADVYQGPKAANPTTRNDGSPLLAGDLYFNTVDKLMRAYTGTIWQAVGGAGDVVGPSSATAGHLPSLDASGKVLSDSGIAASDVALESGANTFLGHNLFDNTASAGFTELRRDTAPLNYAGGRQGFVLQHRDTGPAVSNELVPGAVFQFVSTGDGVVNAGADLSLSIFRGVTAAYTKSGDASASCFEAVGALHTVGAAGYNELGGFQGELTNTGSTHGTMSGLEILLKDGIDTTNHWDTKMSSVIGRIRRRHNGSRKVVNFEASSEGEYPPTAAFSLNAGGLHQWQRGIDLKDGTFTLGHSLLNPNNAAIAWMTSAAAPVSILTVGTTNDTFLAAPTATASVRIVNSAFADRLKVTADPTHAVWIWVGGVLKQVQEGAVNSAFTGFRVLCVPN